VTDYALAIINSSGEPLGSDPASGQRPLRKVELMSNTTNVEELAILATQLDPEDRQELIALIQASLGSNPTTASPPRPLPGSGAAILQALDSLPRLQPGDVEELERAIADGALPVSDEDIFGSDAR